MIRIAYFGLPLGALLLARDGMPPDLAALSPTEAPGRRRLERVLGRPIIDAGNFDAAHFDAEVDRALASFPPDLIVSWYFTRRIAKRWLDRARLGGIGAHPSLLPRHRGPNPFFAAIDSGDTVTGATVHRLTEAYDEGDILSSEALAVDDRNAWQLARALDRPSLRLLRRAVRDIAEGRSIGGAPQERERATWAPEPTGDLLRADFRWTTERVLRRLRALSPVPGLALEIRRVPLLVTEAVPARTFPISLEPGEAAVIEAGTVIRTADGAILLTRACVVDPTTDEVTAIDRAAIAALIADAPDNR